MSLHSFDPCIASRVGVNAAVIYQNILFWTRKNLANGRHIHDEKVWTYNSVKALGELFEYLTSDQIRRALGKLLDEGLIFEGNFNNGGYDRTKWYGVSCQVHLAKTTNGIGENPKPIPDSKPDERDTSVSLALSAPENDRPDLFEDFWQQYPHRNGAKKGKDAARKAWAKAIKARASPEQIISGAMRYAGDRQVIQGYAKDPATWINANGWKDEIEQSHSNSGRGPSGSGGGMVAAFAAVAARRSAGPTRD